MPKSAIMKSKNCETLSRGLKKNAVETRFLCSHSSSLLMRVVFPVPTSPVNRMNPLRVSMPYVRQASASCVLCVRNRERGSGLTLNGFSLSPKNFLYIHDTLSLQLQTANAGPTLQPARNIISRRHSTGFPLAALVWRASGASAIWSLPKDGFSHLANLSLLFVQRFGSFSFNRAHSTGSRCQFTVIPNEC